MSKVGTNVRAGCGNCGRQCGVVLAGRTTSLLYVPRFVLVFDSFRFVSNSAGFLSASQASFAYVFVCALALSIMDVGKRCDDFIDGLSHTVPSALMCMHVFAPIYPPSPSPTLPRSTVRSHTHNRCAGASHGHFQGGVCCCHPRFPPQPSCNKLNG